MVGSDLSFLQTDNACTPTDDNAFLHGLLHSTLRSETDTRLPHRYVHCHPIRLVDAPDVTLKSGSPRNTRPVLRVHLFPLRTDHSKTIQPFESSSPTLSSSRGRSHSVLCLFGTCSSFWRTTDRSRDVSRCHMVWTGGSPTPASQSFTHQLGKKADLRIVTAVWSIQ